jgi:hypothetical protein
MQRIKMTKIKPQFAMFVRPKPLLSNRFSRTPPAADQPARAGVRFCSNEPRAFAWRLIRTSRFGNSTIEVHRTLQNRLVFRSFLSPRNARAAIFFNTCRAGSNEPSAAAKSAFARLTACDRRKIAQKQRKAAPSLENEKIDSPAPLPLNAPAPRTAFRVVSNNDVQITGQKSFFSLPGKNFGPVFHFSADFLCNIFAAFTLNGTNRAARVGCRRNDLGLCRAFA